NLEYIGIHTCGSICDRAEENWNHIKSFNWWTSIWFINDIIEVNIGKNNYEKINRKALRPVKPTKLSWKINDSCEFKNPKNNKYNPTHIFKKLQNNLSKSNIGEDNSQNIREIIIDRKENKIRVNLAEQILSKDVEN
ncbi:13294_t:CDS:2, partial [Funneliformis mosseae]